MEKLKDLHKLSGFDKTGIGLYDDLAAFNEMVQNFLSNQPSAADLKACDGFIRELQSLLIDVSKMDAMAEAFEGALVYAFMGDVENDELIKNTGRSSTLLLKIIYGKWPKAASIINQTKTLKKLCFTVLEDYRTLLSSHKTLGEFINKSYTQADQPFTERIKDVLLLKEDEGVVWDELDKLGIKSDLEKDFYLNQRPDLFNDDRLDVVLFKK